ncbi:MAG: hypothetical protein AAFR26_04905 [Cyanobacteria bacterium J06626_4]
MPSSTVHQQRHLPEQVLEHITLSLALDAATGDGLLIEHPDEPAASGKSWKA